MLGNTYDQEREKSDNFQNGREPPLSRHINSLITHHGCRKQLCFDKPKIKGGKSQGVESLNGRPNIHGRLGCFTGGVEIAPFKNGVCNGVGSEIFRAIWMPLSHDVRMLRKTELLEFLTLRPGLEGL